MRGDRDRALARVMCMQEESQGETRLGHSEWAKEREGRITERYA